MPHPFSISSGSLFRSLFVAVLLTVFFLYAPSLNNDFVNLDDDAHLLENRFLRSLDMQSIKDMFTTTVNQTYIPLTTLTFALEYKCYGTDPFFYHVNNLLLHLAVTGLLMVLARRLGLSIMASALAALIFGIHPLHVESVAWVTQRKDVLYSFFYLFSILAYLKYLDSERKRFLCLSIGLGFLSILAKSMALSLPVILLLCDWFYKGRIRWREVFNKGYFAVFLVPVAWVSFFSNAQVMKGYALQDVLVWIWCFNFYVIKFFIPGQTALFYDLPFPVSLQNMSYVLNLALFVMTGALIWLRRRDRWLLFAFLFYLGSIFFILRFSVILGSVADRFMYLPSLGFCLWGAVVLERILRSSQRNIFGFYAILCALTVLLCSMIGMSVERTFIWKDSISLWKNQLKGNPNTAKWLAYSKLGEAYLESNQVRSALGRLAADRHLGVFDQNDGILYAQRRQDLHLAQTVIDLYEKAIEERPGYAEPYYNLGRIYQSLGDEKIAVSYLEQACLLSKSHFKALLKLAELYKLQGRTLESIERYIEAVKVNPHNIETLRMVEDVFQSAITANDQAHMYRLAKNRLKSLLK